MPWSMPISLVAILMTSAYVTSLPSFMFEKGSHVATAVVRHHESQSQGGKMKRDATSLPATLDFSFHLGNRPIRLRLKRYVNYGGEDLPVFTLKHGVRIKRTMKEDEKNSGFYYDSNQGTALMITRNHSNPSNPFDLEGSLFVDDKEYLMAPSHKFMSGSSSNNNNKNNNKNNNSSISNSNRNRNSNSLDSLFHSDLFDSNSWDNTGMLHSFQELNSRPRTLSYGQDWVDERDPFDRMEAHRREMERRMRRLGQGHDPFTSLSNGKARWKRQTNDAVVDTHFIEVSMVADFAVWKRFLAYAEGDEDEAFQQLQQYYTLIAAMMDVRYQTVTNIDPTLKIRIHPASLIVTNVRQEAIWTERNRVGKNYVNAISSLYTLRNWVRNREGVPEADHTMLFTGYDIAGSGGRDSSTIGVAFIGTACTENSVSLIEEYFTGISGAVSAHELGHSLDAEHDGNYRQCSDYSANVMSTQAIFPSDKRTISNPWIFSPCSVDAFGAFLEKSSCTRNEPKAKDAMTWGRSFNADEQCRLAKGPGSYFCRSVQSRRGFDTMCRRLYCYLPNEPGYCGSIIAGEFTICGDKKWCSQAQCVSNEAAASVAGKKKEKLIKLQTLLQ